MAPDNWQRLHDGKTYKIFEAGDDWFERWVIGIRYHAVDPDGKHVGAAGRRGAGSDAAAAEPVPVDRRHGTAACRRADLRAVATGG